MDKASEALFALKPVSFRYKKNVDRTGSTQLGLIAEEVELVDPGLVLHDKDGRPYTVRYEQVNAMLLNEFLKEHKRVEEQAAKVQEQERKFAQQQETIAQLEFNFAEQQRHFETVAAQQQKSMDSRFSEYEAQIHALSSSLQKVSAQIEVSKAAPQFTSISH